MRKEKITTGVLISAALISVLIPCLMLFREGDWLYYVLRDASQHAEWLEILLFAAVLIPACFLVKDEKVLYGILSVLLLLVAYLHSFLFPLLWGGIWFLVIMSTGNLLEGVGVTVLLAGALSLFSVCTPVTLSVAAAGILLLIRLAGKKKAFFSVSLPSLSDRPLAALCMLVVLTQIGRANECIDYDSLWYGVRSLYVLCPNGSIFEDLGLSGTVYTYSKGFEILTLPLSASSSYSVITAFNLGLFLYGIMLTKDTGKLLGGDKAGTAAAFLTALVPSFAIMTLSAKPDVITWVLQLLLINRFLRAGKEEESRLSGFLSVTSAYLLSLTMKPTSLIFSTALYGMAFLWTLYRKVSGKSGEGKGKVSFSQVFEAVLSFGALLVVWGRTYLLTGLPVTSVFSGILTGLGFTLKYPFSSRSLPSSYQEGSKLLLALKRTAKMLLAPYGEDMDHVIIAWGGSLMFFLCVVILLRFFGWLSSGKRKLSLSSGKALTLFLPLLATSFVTLMMLYQVDGNYYLTAYSAGIFLALSGPEDGEAFLKRRKGLTVALGLLLTFQFAVMTMTSWAGVTGFTEVSENAGFYDHRAEYREKLSTVDGSLYDFLSSDPANRVVAFGEHPDCLQFPCTVQSYNDITSPWGNEELVESADAFIEYLHFAQTDYVYIDASHFEGGAWSWSKGLIEEMTARGVLSDFIYEGEDAVAKVN